ncbi:MAG: DJ-1/PfpI family protein [Candidatus Hydrothermia bacterium]
MVAILSLLLIFGGVKKMEEKKILMIIAHENFRDEELLTPKEIFEKHGFKVTVASTDTSPARGMLGAKVKPDAIVYDEDFSKYDALVLVGGMGSTVYWNDSKLHEKLVKYAENENKILAAICLAPGTLSKAGLLKGKKATIWKSAADEITKGGGTYTGKSVEKDGRIITGNGPDAAKAFAEEIVKSLTEGKK